MGCGWHAPTSGTPINKKAHGKAGNPQLFVGLNRLCPGGKRQRLVTLDIGMDRFDQWWVGGRCRLPLDHEIGA